MELIEDGIFRGLPRRHFGVIHIDVPSHFKSGINPRHPSTKYKTMTLKEIKALPIRDLAAPDCALFFWSSGVWLEHHIPIMKAWGFRRITRAFLWPKMKKDYIDALFLETDAFIATGHTTRKQTEDCLLGKIGKPKRIQKNVRELMFAGRREHSRKPEETFKRIERLYPGPYLDIFGRESRPGWTVWGNESTKFDSPPDPAVRPTGGNNIVTDSPEPSALAPGGSL